MPQIRRLLEKDLDQSLELSQYAFQYKIPVEKIELRKNAARLHEIWGEFEGEALLAKLHIIPLSITIEGKPFQMGGIAGVATWPEHRRKGSVTKLLQTALQSMKEQGQSISLLHPFDISFYRKYGWELFASYNQYYIEKKDLQFLFPTAGRVVRIKKEEHASLLNEIYRRFTKKYNGMLIRTEEWWNNSVFAGDYEFAVYYHDQQATGYLMYQVKDRVMEVEEYIYLDGESRRGLWNYICQHDSMVDQVKIKDLEHSRLPFFLPNPKIKQETIPYFMARIVDLKSFIQQYPFRSLDCQLMIEVEDPFAKWNNQTMVIQDGKAHCEIGQQNPDNNILRTDIQSLTAMFLGLESPGFFFENEKLIGSIEQVKQFELVIGHQKTGFIDFF